jgi:hypothetical protein
MDESKRIRASFDEPMAEVAGGANSKHTNFQHAGLASNGLAFRDGSGS